MIEVEGVSASYDGVRVLRDVSFRLSGDDGVVSIVGPNGAGKSTLLRVLSGLHPIDAGRIDLWDDDIEVLDPAAIVQRGFVHVPEERNLFDGMTVRENLEMGAFTNRVPFAENLKAVYELFPILSDRADQRAGTLSGGEQQMLAIGRGLMAEPKVLALDEPSQGLAPRVTARVFETIEAIRGEVTVLLVEQYVHDALTLADHAYVMENGEFVAGGAGDALLASGRVERAYL